LDSNTLSLNTAAEVSSHEDSMPRMTVPMTTFFTFVTFG